ncbi:MAG: VOC family protein [Leptolyngbyaceae bacterium]|nr:VOC family protein [Leptolyngbyaceae bacterium]
MFRYAWERLSYSEMARITGYDPGYLKDVGFKLWRSLEKKLGKKITKKNFQEVLEQYSLDSQFISSRVEELPSIIIGRQRIVMQITRSLHAALLVTDLERAEHFYGTILGLPKVERVLKFPGTWYQIGDFQIHLIVAPSVKSDRVNEEKWGRNRHLALAVADIEVAKAQLLAHDCPIQVSASGRAALFTQDPDGNLIELGEA